MLTAEHSNDAILTDGEYGTVHRQHPSFRRTRENLPLIHIPSEQHSASFSDHSSRSYAARMPFSDRLTTAQLEDIVRRTRSSSLGGEVSSASSRASSPSPQPNAAKEKIANPSSARTNEKPSAKVNIEEDAIPSDIKCPVCLDVFAAPVTLGCLHSVCKAHVFDLAAARREKPPHSSRDDAIIVDCPKCRQTTTFDNGIRVNSEMQGIVDAMVNLLRRTATHIPEPPHSSASPRAAVPKSVRFCDEPSISAALNEPVSQAPVSVAPQRKPQSAKLSDLDEELQRKRQEAECERERRRKIAVENYKRSRQQEALAKEQHEKVMDSEASPSHHAELHRRQQQRQRSDMRESQERLGENELLRGIDEEKVRADLSKWLQDAALVSHDVEKETKEFEKKLHDALGVDDLSASFRRDAMRRAAEMRLPRPSSGNGDGRHRRATPSFAAPLPRDIEVEMMLLDVERIAQREADSELTRAEMAELAERRARDEIEKFRRAERANRGWVAPNALVDGVRDRRPVASSALGSNSGFILPSPRASYVPKLHRLQRVSS